MAGSPTRRPIPFVDPLTAYAATAGGGMAVLLESAAPGPGSSRYSVVATEPVAVVVADAIAGWEQLTRLEQTLPRCPPLPAWPFGPGLLGSLGYELRRAFERTPSRHRPTDGPADIVFGLFDTVAVFDHVERQAVVLAADLPQSREPAARRADRLADRIAGCQPLTALDWSAGAAWTPERSAAAYRGQVDRVLDYIMAGDIYQANFTQRWVADRPAELDALGLYRRLRSLSPAPYAGLIEDGAGNAIVSASPERFLSLSASGRIETRPIKGTRPRGATAEDDRAQAKALVESEKDRAENLMIVDLLRNDLGRVARTGSVAAPELFALYSFASVHHLVSTVTADLRAGLGPLDLIAATFPGGSVTGAPKIRAMQIIDELEASRRGVYCGAIGWIGLDRAMELSIAIRTMTLTSTAVVAQAGGGIVADSDPAAEHQEALTKARAMLGTLDETYRTSGR